MNKELDIIIRSSFEYDMKEISKIHMVSFRMNSNSKLWIECNYKAFPKSRYFVAEYKDYGVIAYILWTIKGGFHPEIVLELEQLAVVPKYRRRGVGSKLVLKSLDLVKDSLSEMKYKIKLVMVTVKAGGIAEELYRKTIGAKITSILPDLYSCDENIMIARNI